jgi:hypothetical protein
MFGTIPSVKRRKNGQRSWLGAHALHISLSRSRVKGTRVKEPRHVLLYHRRDERIIEVGRVIHESQDLNRHLPKAYQGKNTGED